MNRNNIESKSVRRVAVEQRFWSKFQRIRLDALVISNEISWGISEKNSGARGGSEATPAVSAKRSLAALTFGFIQVGPQTSSSDMTLDYAAQARVDKASNCKAIMSSLALWFV